MSSVHIESIDASEIKVGMYLLYKGRPGKVLSCLITKTGKHGHMAVHFVLRDVLTYKKTECLEAGHCKVWMFSPKRVKYTVTAIYDGNIDCIDDKCNQVTFNYPEDDHYYLECVTKMGKLEEIQVVSITAPVGDIESLEDQTILEN